jgi:hypothetical protein
MVVVDITLVQVMAPIPPAPPPGVGVPLMPFAPALPPGPEDAPLEAPTAPPPPPP